MSALFQVIQDILVIKTRKRIVTLYHIRSTSS